MPQPDAHEINDSISIELNGAVGRIIFKRPQALNALNLAMAEGFLSAVKTAIAHDARALILSGAGRAFMAGGDLAYLAAAEDRGAAALSLIQPINEALRLLAANPVLTIAALRGPVAGAGMSLALAADFAIADSTAVFSFAYIKVAATPDCGGSWRLTQLVGVRRALEIALLADPLTADQAATLGLINRVVEAEALEATCEKLASRLANLPVHAAHATRQLISAAATVPFDAQLEHEAALFAEIARKEEFRDHARAFLSKKKTET